MNNNQGDDERTCHIVIFSFLMVSLLTLFVIANVVTHSEHISSFFVNDSTNTWMDYFNMLANMYWEDPYSNDANYPALSFVFWKVMYYSLPTEETVCFVDGFYLRQNMMACIGAIIVALMCVLVIYSSIRRYVTIHNGCKAWLLPACFLLSGPMLFCLERGNITIMAFAFTLLFFVFYNSPNKKLRYIAYLSLSIAAGIKLYPALFGLLVILNKNKDKNELYHFILMGFALFFVPFFFFNGIESIADFISNYLYSSRVGHGWGLGYNYSFDSIVNTFLAIGGYYHAVPSIVCSITAFVICGVLFVLSKETWKKVLSISLACIWIPSFSFTYTLIFLTIPLLVYLLDSESNRKPHYTIMFAMIMSPSITPFVGFINDSIPWVLPLSYGTMAVNCLIVAVALSVFVEDILSRRSSGGF